MEKEKFLKGVKIMHVYQDSWDYKGVSIIDCTTCGFKHIYPIPTEKSIKAYYQKYYEEIKPFNYSVVNQKYIEKKTQEIINTKEYASIFKKVTELNQTGSQRMLDVGAGNNLLNKYFQIKGWKVWVVEPNQAANDYLEAFGLNLFNNTIEELDFSLIGDLSLINIQFVLEHLRDPISFLEKSYQALVPGGIIRICVPNDFSAGQMAYKEYGSKEADWIVVPDHINYFDFNSLSALLAQIGFLEVYRRTNFPLEFLLLGGIDYYTSPEEQKKVAPFVNNFEKSFKETNKVEELESLYYYLAKAGFGRSIFIYGQKPLANFVLKRKE